MKPKDYSGDPCFIIIEYKPEFNGNVYKFYPFNSEAVQAHFECMEYLKQLKNNRSYAV